VKAHTRAIRLWIDRHMPTSRGRFKVIELLPFVDDTIEKVRYLTRKRKVLISREEGESRLNITMNPEILGEILEALLKNAVKNTPDGGQVVVKIEKRGDMAWIDVVDTGVGISGENQPYIFDGLFHTTETDLYSSRGPYDFGSGGKGLDLLKLKVYAKRFGFELAMTSTRCPHIPTDRDICPGKVSDCLFVKSAQECALSGGSTFSVAFRTSRTSIREKRKRARQ
jgi:signal transduction histidine kinase